MSTSQYPLIDNLVISFDYGVNTLGVDLWRRGDCTPGGFEYDDLFSMRLSGYCKKCAAIHALYSAGFDPEDTHEILESNDELFSIVCECD